MTQLLPRTVPRTPAPRRAGAPCLSVVIVNYRQWANTDRLVRLLRRCTAISDGFAEIIIVDNDSPPHPARARSRRTPGVSVRRLPRNVGFARAANEGCRLSRGHWFLLLNPDVSVEPQFLDHTLKLIKSPMTQPLIAQPRIGIIGLRSLDPGGAVQSCTGRDPTLLATLLGPLRPRAIRKGLPPVGSRRRTVPWVTGCGLLIRRECFTQLDGFDPAFFLYYEDADLCRRARKAGWQVCHEPALSVIHHHPLHGRAVPPRTRLMDPPCPVDLCPQTLASVGLFVARADRLDRSASARLAGGAASHGGHGYSRPEASVSSGVARGPASRGGAT